MNFLINSSGKKLKKISSALHRIWFAKLFIAYLEPLWLCHNRKYFFLNNKIVYAFLNIQI